MRCAPAHVQGRCVRQYKFCLCRVSSCSSTIPRMFGASSWARPVPVRKSKARCRLDACAAVPHHGQRLSSGNRAVARWAGAAPRGQPVGWAYPTGRTSPRLGETLPQPRRSVQHSPVSDTRLEARRRRPGHRMGGAGFRGRVQENCHDPHDDASQVGLGIPDHRPRRCRIHSPRGEIRVLCSGRILLCVGHREGAPVWGNPCWAVKASFALRDQESRTRRLEHPGFCARRRCRTSARARAFCRAGVAGTESPSPWGT